MSFSLLSNSLLEELQEYWSSMETPPPGAMDSFAPNPNELSPPILGESVHTPLNDSNWPYDTTNLEWNDVDVDQCSPIFEFFDLQNAALDLDKPQHPQPEAEAGEPSASTSRTLYSPVAHHATPNVPSASASRTLYSPMARHATPSKPSLEPEIYPNLASNPNVRESTDVQLAGNGKRPFQIDLKDVLPNTAKRQKFQTPEQLEDARKIRAHGACLRCYVQKLKCSEGRPCTTCQNLLEKARNNRTLQWSTCVSSSLSELNIFALGVFRQEVENYHPGGEQIQPKPSFTSAFSCFHMLFKIGLFSDAIVPIDQLYMKVLRQTYDRHAADIHPFILEDRNPLYLLVRLNVILLGSPVIATELIGRVRYLQKLRAICAIVAFELLGRAINRTALARSTEVRRSALIVQISLLLDQVVAMNGMLPAAALSCAQGDTFKEMRQHLIQFLTFYLQKLIPNCRGPFSLYLQGLEHERHLGDNFWNSLSHLMPLLPLRKPPMVREYTEMSWRECGTEIGEVLQDFFSKHCSIKCE